MKEKLPNFLIVGAAKSGTTSLYYYIKEHPEAFMPKIKEPRFFDSEIYKNLNKNVSRYDELIKYTIFNFEEYINLFSDAENYKAVGEATATYLYHYEIAIPKIKQYLGDVKIIIILRNPIERAFSSYCHLKREGVETLSFQKCLSLESVRKSNNWDVLSFFIDGGMYFKQVEAYLKNFSEVRIFLYDDLKNNTKYLIKKLYNFLNIDPGFVPNYKIKHNETLIPKSKFIHKFFSEQNRLKKFIKPLVQNILHDSERKKIVKKIKSNNLYKPSLDYHTREYLKNIYREEILRTQDLIKRSLDHWLL